MKFYTLLISDYSTKEGKAWLLRLESAHHGEVWLGDSIKARGRMVITSDRFSIVWTASTASTPRLPMALDANAERRLPHTRAIGISTRRGEGSPNLSGRRLPCACLHSRGREGSDGSCLTAMFIITSRIATASQRTPPRQVAKMHHDYAERKESPGAICVEAAREGAAPTDDHRGPEYPADVVNCTARAIRGRWSARLHLRLRIAQAR